MISDCQWSGRPYFISWSSHTKFSKMVLDVSLLYTQHNKVWIKGKRNNPKKRLVPSPPPQCDGC